MELKDKLKKLRSERGITQQALANAIFISRSAVAKWESGIGLPSDDSRKALANYFSVSEDYLKSNSNDEILVEKNKKIHKIISIALSVVLISGCIFSTLITVSVFSNSWGLMPEFIAGDNWLDNPKYEFEDYIIYYSTMKWSIADTDKTFLHICTFKPLKKELIGYSFDEQDYQYRNLYFKETESDEMILFAKIYSIKGENCYYNIIISHSSLIPQEFIAYDEIISRGVSYTVEYNSFFISKDYPEVTLVIGEREFVIADQ